MKVSQFASCMVVCLGFALAVGCGGSCPVCPVGQKANQPSGGASDTGTSDTAPVAKSSSVMLGSPELTAGIAGEGSLSASEIKTWLDDPANHEMLEVELPLGLSAGQSSIVGLDANPLTRAKIELGRQLYFDTRLSSDDTVSCASCHDPDEGYARHTRFGIGVDAQEGDRNSPVSYNRILSALV